MVRTLEGRLCSSYDLLQSRDWVSPSCVYALINSSFLNWHTSSNVILLQEVKNIVT